MRSDDSASSVGFFTRSILLSARRSGCLRPSRPETIRSTLDFIPSDASMTSRIRSASCAPVQAAATIARSRRRRGAKMPGVSTSRICVWPVDRDAHQPGAGGLRLRADDRHFLADQGIDQGRLAGVGRADHGDETGAGWLYGHHCGRVSAIEQRGGRGGFRFLLAGALGGRFAELRHRDADREFGRVMCASARNDFVGGALTPLAAASSCNADLGCWGARRWLARSGPQIFRMKRCGGLHPAVEK